MALINCTECGKEISDKAASCPGCGCPVEIIIPPQPPIQIDCTKYDCNELWHKAYDIQYKGKKSDLPTALDIYKYIVDNYSDSPNAGYASKQLEILGASNKVAFDKDCSAECNNFSESENNHGTKSKDINLLHESSASIKNKHYTKLIIGVCVICVAAFFVYLDNSIGTSKAIKYVFKQRMPNAIVKDVTVNNIKGNCKEFSITLDNGNVVNGVTTITGGLLNIFSKDHYEFEILSGMSQYYRDITVNNVCEQPSNYKAAIKSKKYDDSINANGRKYNKDDTVDVNGYKYEKFYGKPLYNEYGKQIQSNPY